MGCKGGALTVTVSIEKLNTLRLLFCTLKINQPVVDADAMGQAFRDGCISITGLPLIPMSLCDEYGSSVIELWKWLI